MSPHLSTQGTRMIAPFRLSPAASLLLLTLVACGPPREQVTPPSAPRNVAATAGNTTATVSWDTPTSDGGSAITGYLLTGNGGISLSATAGARSVVVTGLTNGVTYIFSVAAQNAVGAGPSASAEVTPVVLTGVPGAPTSVVAYAGDAAVTVSWSAPVDQGSSAITSYRVVASPGGAYAQVTVPLRTATVAGLTNGVVYTFIVMAINAVGEGTPSAPSASVTPSAPAFVSRLPYKGLLPSTSYASTVVQVAGNSLDSSASALASGGHVLTCAVYNTAGYTLVGIKPSVSSDSYTSQVKQVLAGVVPPTAASMGADGYLVTAMIHNTAGYTLFGTRISNTTYDTRVDQVPYTLLDKTTSTNAAEGYVTTAMVYNSAGYTLISVKDNSDPRIWSSQVQQVSESSLNSTVSGMASAGYAVTAMVYNTAGYTLVGMKEGMAQTATSGVADQVAGADPSSAISGRASTGYVTLAISYGTTDYAFVSSR